MNESQKIKALNMLTDLQNRIDIAYAFINSLPSLPDESAKDTEPTSLLKFTKVDQEKREIEFGGLINQIRKNYQNPDGSTIHIDELDFIRELQNKNLTFDAVKATARQWIHDQGKIKRGQPTTKGPSSLF